MLLRDYLAGRNETPLEFGARIGARSPATVYRYLSGMRRPTPRLLRRIMEATAGAVTANDFVGDARAKQGTGSILPPADGAAPSRPLPDQEAA